MYCVNPINVISINKKLILNPSAAYSVQWLKPLKNTSSSHPVTRVVIGVHLKLKNSLQI